MAILSEKVNTEICGALGLDSGDVYYLNITLRAREVATLTVGSFLRNEQGEKIGKVLKDYKIEPKDGI